MKKLRGWKRIIIYFIVGLTLIVLVAPPVLNKIIENNVKEKLKQLAPMAIVRFSSIYADLIGSSISINDLSVKFQPDTLDHRHHHSFSFSKVDLTGIDFIEMVLHKKLSINKLQLNKGEIELDQFLLDKNDSGQYDLSSRLPFRNVSVGRFETNETNVWTRLNQENKLLLRGRIIIDSMAFNNSHQSSAAKNFCFNAIQCNVTNIDYPIPASRQKLQIKQLSLDSRKGFLGIDSLKFIVREANDKQTPHVEAFITSMSISKFDVLKLVEKKLIAGTVIVNKSDARFFNRLSIPENNILREIQIGSLVIKNSSCSLTSLQFRIRKMEVTGLKRSFDSSLNYSSFNCSISNIKYSLPHGYRTLHISSLDADSKKKLLKIADVKITTQYPKIEYGKKLGRQADYIEATAPIIEIADIDFKQLPKKRLVADKVMIDESKFYFFRDRRLPRQLKEQPMPNDYLQQSPIDLRVNTFKINNASVVYEEFPKVGSETGYLTIGKMNISMSPMLNHPAKNDPGYSETYVEGSIMNAGLIKATIRAPFRRNIYFIKGNIKNLDLPKLNPSAENLGRFHIESGILNFLDFHFTATEEIAKGEIVGEYHDLLIDRLKKGEKKVAKVPTFFLKHFIIPKNKDRSLAVKKRTGKIEYKRDPTRLVSYYLLKSLLDGIRASFTLGFLLPK